MKVVYYIRTEEQVTLTQDEFRDWLMKKRKELEEYFKTNKVYIDVIG